MHVRRFTVLVLTILTLSCSSPPDKERQQAADAVAAARAQEAALYAPAELAAAEEALAGYDAAVAQRDYRRALSLAIDARDRAHAASRSADARRSEARVSSEQLLRECDSAIEAMRRRLAVTGANRLSSAAAARLRAATKAAEPSLKQAQTLIGRHDYRGASMLLTPLLQTLRQTLADADARPAKRNR